MKADVNDASALFIFWVRETFVEEVFVHFYVWSIK